MLIVSGMFGHFRTCLFIRIHSCCRFDLAATLARELHAVDRLSAFFDIIHQDPVIGRVKLVAEPWDLGEGGYQVGKIPPG